MSEEALKEGSFINLSINFKELGPLDDILGKVKRVEKSEENDYYVGIEFYSQEQIKAEVLSNLFPEKINSFEAELKSKLLEYFCKGEEQFQKINSGEKKS